MTGDTHAHSTIKKKAIKIVYSLSIMFFTSKNHNNASGFLFRFFFVKKVCARNNTISHYRKRYNLTLLLIEKKRINTIICHKYFICLCVSIYFHFSFSRVTVTTNIDFLQTVAGCFIHLFIFLPNIHTHMMCMM